MPYASNPATTEDSDLYSDSGSAAPAEAEPRAEEGEESEGHKTTVVPISALGEGVQPGDRCEFEVMRVYDDQAEIRYIEEGEEGGEGGEGGEASAPSGGSEYGSMESMME